MTFPLRSRVARRVAAPAALLLAMALVGCAADDVAQKGDDSPAGGAKSLVLASQNFDEAQVVAALYGQVLEQAGYDVETKLVGSRSVYMADFPGEVDVVPEYVGGISDYLNTTANGPDAKSLTTSDAQESIDATDALLSDAGITLLDPSPAFSANAFFVSKDYAASLSAPTLSALKGKKVVLAAMPDCQGRSDCEGGLSDVYGIEVTKILDTGFGSPQTYQAVADGEAQLGETGTTDGTLESQGLVMLEDDQKIQPAQNLVPAVDSDFLVENEGIVEPLNDLMAALDNDKLAAMVVKVSVDRQKPADVAKEFLSSEGLI